MRVSARTAHAVLRLLRADWWVKLLFALPYRHPLWVDFCPAAVRRQYVIRQQTHDDTGRRLVTFHRHAEDGIHRSKGRHSRLHIVFFHGGGYVLPAFRVHWQWVADCVDALGCTATMVQYPLAPESDCQTTVAAARRAYETMVRQYPDDAFVLMGDSAGGGLCMVLNQQLYADRHPQQPVANVLLSPWVELSNRMEQMQSSPTGENRLYGRMAHRAAQRYARGMPLHTPILSPLYGDLSVLAPSLVAYGLRDIVAQDCQRMQAMTEALPEDKRPLMNFLPFPDMGHVWFFLPIAQRAQCLQAVCTFLRNTVQRRQQPL